MKIIPFRFQHEYKVILSSLPGDSIPLEEELMGERKILGHLLIF